MTSSPTNSSPNTRTPSVASDPTIFDPPFADQTLSDRSRTQLRIVCAPGVAGERTLVLGGGGSTGHAWEIGVVAGLFDAGVDVTRADVIVGTSAGATVAAQLGDDATPTSLFARIIDASASPRSQSSMPTVAPAPFESVSAYLERTSAVIAAATDPLDMRRRMGAAALAWGDPSPDAASRRRAIVAARLDDHDWPARAVRITAVDAHSGEPVVFDRLSGVDLVDAIAASTASGFGSPPHPIGSRHYIDGAYRRNENADLASGCPRVLVLSPLSGRSRYPSHWGMQLSVQVEELRDAGSAVEVLVPDPGSQDLLGTNAMDIARRPLAARAGYRLGRWNAARLLEFWG